MSPKQIIIDGVIGTAPGEISASMVKSQLPTTGEPIELVIHSEGGSVFEGFAIFDAVNEYPGPKTASIKSSAFSIASLIPMACDEINITPNGYMMIHRPYGGVEGDDEQMSNQAELIRDMRAKMTTAYAIRSGRSEEEIAAMMERETFLNAEKCLAMGFVNRITDKPVAGRPLAKMEAMPHGVVVALCNANPGGENREPTTGNPMAETQPVAAATLQEIKAAYPKAKAEFVLKCLEKSMPMASVAQAAIEEMMAENAALRAEIKAMQEEMAGKAKAMEGEDEEPVAVEHEEEEMEVAPVAKARRVGVAPVARGQGVSHSASIRWDSVVTTCLAKCNGNKVKAVAMANKQNPGLRQAYLDEINARK
jgi:ATP-dependent Clp endopeptidase proteolytic subunit ClpP